jgi:RimJ/RimL family protein N-acetyltransferase
MQPELRTKHLVLRRFQREDASEVQKLAGNFNVAKMTLNIPFPYEDGMAEEWISTHEENWNTKKSVIYAILKTGTNKLLGAVGLVEIDGLEGELGYWIGEPYWGKGYCTEAAKKLIEFSFQKLSLEKIVAEHLTKNPASGRVMKKIGMQYVKTTQKIDRNGNTSSMEVYEIKNT